MKILPVTRAEFYYKLVTTPIEIRAGEDELGPSEPVAGGPEPVLGF
jgi:hypothetical protein